jgi:2-polyprenyl-3-methyl-5-hydroxy-6-metoxy-1,4-benzoquinol methylase
MQVAEEILFQLARALYRTEIAHSSEMKNAQQNIDASNAYRAGEVNRILKTVERYRIPILGQTIVDFGCNDGAISAEYLARGAAKVIGLDIDECAIQRAQALHHDERLLFIQNRADSIPLDSQSVDVLISFDVFEHVSQPTMILKEIHRVLTPRGKALIGTWSWYHPFAPHLWAVMPVPWAQVFFSEQTILRVCRRVYHSSWYVPNMHDYDKDGQRRPDKYNHQTISTDYLNKFLIKDFEQAFLTSGFIYETSPAPFGSRYARWTRVFMHVPWFREFIAGYVWFILTKSTDQVAN